VTQALRQTDQDIQANVFEELKYDPSCDAGQIKVTADSGIVKLTGEVASFRQKLAAKRSAMRVRGVKAISDELTVRGPDTMGASDADMTDAAHRILSWTADVPAEAVKVAVKDRKMTLSGTVAWSYQRDAALRAMTNLRGVAGVRDEIVLEQPESTAPAKNSIAAAMQRNAQLEPLAIHVDVNNHELVLRGMVRSFAEYRQAERTAWNAAGVTSVQNKLVIAS
jgi:osmotically-inducible protein OsmY